MQRALKSGTSEFVRTKLVQPAPLADQQHQQRAIVEALPFLGRPQLTSATAAQHLVEREEEEEEEESEEEEPQFNLDNHEMLVSKKRKRVPTEKFVPGRSISAKPKAAAPAAAKKQSKNGEQQGEMLINPKTGLPYVRGPYERRSTAKELKAAALAGEAASGVSSRKNIRAPSTADPTELDALKIKLKEAQNEVKRLTEALNSANAALSMAETAKGHELAKVKAEAQLAQSADIHVAFQRGLEAGARLATGRAFTVENSPAASSGSSSVGRVLF
ncbi:hypothetical protein AB1Y20_021073 [Prymnesium parvum]|uniref:Ribosome biogenesis protein NOP53 n=1 Tax=Prymnesium parvum TaxID=97485 RepID=A0AB34JL90_PRYPA